MLNFIVISSEILCKYIMPSHLECNNKNNSSESKLSKVLLMFFLALLVFTSTLLYTISKQTCFFFICMQYKSFKNTVRKGETNNFSFPLVLSTLYENFFIELKLSSANSFSLEVLNFTMLEPS